jgi:transposase
MKKPRRQYTREFKMEAVRLLETSGKSVSELERELGLGKGNLWRWRKKFAADGEVAFPGHGRLTPEQEEIRRLKRELEITRQQRDILKKAVAIFSHPSE